MNRYGVAAFGLTALLLLGPQENKTPEERPAPKTMPISWEEQLPPLNLSESAGKIRSFVETRYANVYPDPSLRTNWILFYKEQKEYEEACKAYDLAPTQESLRSVDKAAEKVLIEILLLEIKAEKLKEEGKIWI